MYSRLIEVSTEMPAVEQLLDVLVALGVPAAGRVVVGQAVDRGRPADGGVRMAATSMTGTPSTSCVGNRPSSSRTSSRDVGRHLRLERGHDDVLAALAPAPPLVEQPERLADARRVAEEDLELPAALPHRSAAWTWRSSASGSRRADAVGRHRPRMVARLYPTVDAGTACRLPARQLSVEREVQLQHVDARLADETEPRAVRSHCCDERSNRAGIDATRLRHARRLNLGVRRTDVRIEAAGRGRHRVGRNRPGVVRVLLAVLIDRRLDAIDQLLVRRSVVRARSTADAS